MAKRLPKGWKRIELGELVDISSGGTPSRANPDFWGGTTPWITAKDLKTFDLHGSEDRLSDGGAARSAMVPADTLLVLVRGMGLFKDVPIGITNRPMAFNQDVKALRPKGGVTARFLGYALKGQRHYLMGRVDQAGHGTGRLQTSFLEELPLPIPPMDQQRRIVLILDACNGPIEKTEKLIAAKEYARTRLVQKHILKQPYPHHCVSDFIIRVNRKNTAGNGHPLTISGRDGLVSQSHYFVKRVAAEATQHYTLLKRGEFAYNKSYSTGYPCGAIKRLDSIGEGIVSSLYLCFAVRPDVSLISDYLAYFCDAGGFNRQIHMIAQEGARNHGLLNVAADDFFAMTIPLPSWAQQEHVVAVLGAANEELRLLRRLLELLHQQKRGLMQKLLSGEWRLTTDLPLPEMAHG